MGYSAVEQHDYDSSQDEDDATGTSSRQRKASLRPLTLSSLGLFLDHHNTRPHEISPSNARDPHPMVSSITSRSTNTNHSSYDMLENDDFEDLRSRSPPEKQRDTTSSEETSVPLRIPNPRRRPKPATGADFPAQQPFFPSEPLPRTTSGCNIGLRHPTPDLQALQGAYVGNIENLEKTAERLSMTSSIEDAIKELHDEQKRSDSRRSSLMSSQGIGPISRQVSNASSIVEVNSTARSGGFSPAGFLLSPKSSFTNIHGRGRSTSKSLKLSRTEPEMEGRPLDSFNLHSPTFSGTDSVAEQDEDSSTMKKPVVGQIDTAVMEEIPKSSEEGDRPTTSATEELEGAFADFDGTHSEPLQPRSISTIPGASEMINSTIEQQRVSSGARLSMLAPRPQSYADPNTGQEMVYYPAPVPMMLNLPQKLSKNPSSMARNKRRSQVLSSIPAAARQSAVWLPDVLENEEIMEDEDTQGQEYMPQHQRASMGGRRLTQDLSHMPPQLRASTYFDLPDSPQIVELKDQSAVATLDSILDASAHAPVSAFTDHAFAGTLGAEVYGKSHLRNSQSISQLSDKQPKKRSSSFNLLRRRNSGGADLDDAERDKTRSMLTSVIQSATRSPIEEDDEDDLNKKDTTPLQESEVGNSRNFSGDFAVKQPEDEGSDDGQLDDEIYHGPPTTLLAELQLRKQRQKQRTQPLTKTFPNGIHSTLLEMDTVIQTEQRTRKKGRTILAWEDPAAVQAEVAAAEDDDDVPLAMLFSKKAEENRPLGLMERRELEDNEPLSKRRERLQGRPPAMPRASTMMHLSGPTASGDDEGETLAQRVKRLKETTIPATRPVSGDFATEMMSQFGGDLLSDPKDKGKVKIQEPAPSPGPEEEETLGQRRKRLQAEREARAREVGIGAQHRAQRPEPTKRRSMADILQAHPSAGADRAVNYQKPVGGLLSLQENHARRSSTMINPNTSAAPFAPQHAPRKSSGGFKSGMYNDGQGGIVPLAQVPKPVYHQRQLPSMGGGMFPQPSLGMGNTWANPYPMNMNMGYDPNQFQMQLEYMQQQMNMMAAPQPPNQGQIDMVERWRQSVMQ